MPRKKSCVVSSTLFTLLTMQLFCTDSMQAAPSYRREASMLSVAKKQAQLVDRPVRPDGVETGRPVVGEEIFIARYPDGSVYIEREVALDEEGNYVNHGPYRIWSRNGKLIAEGEYDMAARVGIWTRWADRKESPFLSQPPLNKFDAPFLSQASFVNGVLDGEWLIFDAKQRKCSQVSFSNGKRHGLALMWAPDGKILLQSNFENGMPQGDVLQLKSSTGDLGLVNSFLDGRELVNKKTRFTRSQQTKTEANYLAALTVETASDDFWNIRFAKYKVEGENIRHGEWKTWHPNGKLHMRGQYYRDQKVDYFVYWHSNGQIAAEGEYRNDNYEGEWAWWHPNGQKAVTGSFRNGALIDQWRWWDEVGRLTKQVRHDGSKTILSHEDAELELGLQEHIPWPIKR